MLKKCNDHIQQEILFQIQGRLFIIKVEKPHVNMSHIQSGGVCFASLVFLLCQPGLPHNLAGDDVHGWQDTKVWQICPHVQVDQNHVFVLIGIVMNSKKHASKS